MKIRSILVAAVLAFGFANTASALTNQNTPAHQYTNTVQHSFYGQ